MENVENKQLAALGFCAFTVPAILYLSRVGWLWAGLSAVVLYALLRAGGIAITADTKAKKLFVLIIVAWNCLMLGVCSLSVCSVYEVENELPALLLLLFASYAAAKKSVPRVAAVVLFFLAAIYAALFAFSVPGLKLGRIVEPENPNWSVLPYALAPGLLLYMYQREKKRSKLWLLGAGALAVLAAGVTSGLRAPDFYTAAKSVNILGVMERLEPLVAAALTAGGFCLLGLICCVNQKLFASMAGHKETQIAAAQFLLGAGSCFLAPVLPDGFIAVGMAIFWGVVPLCLQGVVARKKSKNYEKNA